MLDTTLATAVRPVVLHWLRRLADRFSELKEQVRLGVIEAVGRTAAEAAEVALRAAFGVARRYDPAPPDWPPDEFADDPDDECEAIERRPAPPPVVAPARPRWSWRLTATAALQGLSWWLRRQAPQPLAAAVAALIGAALVLLD